MAVESKSLKLDVEKSGLTSVPWESSTTLGKGDLLSKETKDDLALSAKMSLVNDAIDEIGWTRYHTKLFLLNGFGYAVDSLVLLLQSIIASSAAAEFQPSLRSALTIAVYVGMLLGALFWGYTADVIGRKLCFNTSLFICSIAAIVAGASPRWEVLAFFIALAGFGAGGNLILDTTVFLEYLPSNKQWILTLLACWWGVGQLIAGLFAWAFLPNFSCGDPPAICNYDNNKGWRYEMYVNGALVFIMSVARITVIKLRETPKFLLGEGKDSEVVDNLQGIARKYNRTCSLTLADLEHHGVIKSSHATNGRWSFGEFSIHVKGLFATKLLGISTALIWLSWTLIGLAYPLYNVFLPDYLKSRGADVGGGDPYTVWRNYAIVNLSGVFGPILAAFMCNWSLLGRKYTMVVGALITMAFFFAYTQVRTPAENLGFNCAINFFVNVYYGTLYAYTVEVLPSAHRATGNGIAVAFNRVMGIVSAIIATVADTNTPVPIFICAALYVVMAGVAVLFPFEPFGRRSS